MPKLPDVTNLGGRPVPVSRRGIATIDTTAVGRAVEGLGRTLSDAGEREQKEADAQAVFEAKRKLDEWERENVYSPETGAINKLGQDAFELPKKLPSAYDDFASKVTANLGNNRQKEAFREVAASRRNHLTNWVDRHALQQRDVFEQGQFEADLSAFTNRAALLAGAGEYDNASAELKTMQSRTIGFLRNRGRSEEEIGQKVQEATSRAHLTVLGSLLESEKVVDADKYLKANASGMRADDLLKAQSAAGKQMDARAALVAADEVIRDAQAKAAPTDMDRLTGLVMQAESGGKRYGSDGGLLTSPKGAKGEMQVMDATNRDPGFGVTPAKDDSPEERARVGREYLAAMVKEFKGDARQALAAYNAGPGAVKEAVARAEARPRGDWLTMLPRETQEYVGKITKLFSDGPAVSTMPTVKDVHDEIRRRVGVENPQRLRLALEEGSRRYDDLVKAKKQSEDEAEAAAMQWLQQNGGRFSAMPPNLRNALAPKSVDNVMSFGQKVAKGDDITDPIVFQKMATDEAFLKNMTDAQFYVMSRKLSEADAQQMALRRGKLIEGKEGQNPADLNTQAVNSVLNNRLQQLGIDPSPKDTDAAAVQRVGAVRKFVWDSVLQAQLSTGKKFTDAEITNKVDELFTKSVKFRETFMGLDAGATSHRLLGLTYSEIPDDIRGRIEDDFKAQGVSEPLEADVLGVYFRMRSR